MKTNSYNFLYTNAKEKYYYEMEINKLTII